MLISKKMINPTKVIGDAEQGKQLPELLRRAGKDSKIKRIIDGEEQAADVFEEHDEIVRVYLTDKAVTNEYLSKDLKLNLIITNDENVLIDSNGDILTGYGALGESGLYLQRFEKDMHGIYVPCTDNDGTFYRPTIVGVYLWRSPNDTVSYSEGTLPPMEIAVKVAENMPMIAETHEITKKLFKYLMGYLKPEDVPF